MRFRMPREMYEAPTLDPTLCCPPPQPRHALLINPFYPKDPLASFGKHVLTPTLALTSFAAATPANWTVRYWDENLLQGPPPHRPFPQVVAITVHLTFAERTYALARWYRQRGATVVLGGLHVLSCPDVAARHADVLAIGEGVHIWPAILRDLEAGRRQNVYQGSYRTAYREDPPPRRDLLDRRAYLTTTSLNATRGCHNRCGYCYLATDGLHIPYQYRDPAQIVSEVQNDNQPYFVFTDNNLGSKPDYLRRLCQSLRPLEKIWSAAVSLDVTDDPSLVREMALAGCTGVFVGFESLTDANLREARKKSPRAEEFARRVRIFHDHGVQVNGSFVVGFDHDRADCFQTLVDWIVDVRMESATYHILTPYPSTPLFKQMEGEGRLLHKDWKYYDTAHVVFRPKLMSPEQLAEGYAYLYRRTFSPRCIWQRRPRDLRAVPAYLAMSALYKKMNRVWPFLIRHRLTHLAWSPLLELSRRRHLRFRRQLATRGDGSFEQVRIPVYAGV